MRFEQPELGGDCGKPGSSDPGIPLVTARRGNRRDARSTLRQAAALLLAASLPALISAWVTHPQWDENALREGEIALAAASAQQPPPLWIDARSAKEFAARHIPGALPLNEDDWDGLLPNVLQQWQPEQAAIVYCSAKHCQTSHDVAKRLKEFNVGPVYVLKGGWEAWRRR